MPDEVPHVIDFEVVEETWTDYRLTDGTIIRIRPCLVFHNAIDTGTEDGDSMGRVNTQVQSWAPEPERRPEEAGPSLAPDELEDNIVEENVPASLIREGQSIYRTPLGTLRLKGRIKRFHKTSEYDPDGNPQYLLEQEIEILTEEDEDPKRSDA